MSPRCKRAQTLRTPLYLQANPALLRACVRVRAFMGPPAWWGGAWGVVYFRLGGGGSGGIGWVEEEGARGACQPSHTPCQRFLYRCC